jgi:hypothetical protein
MTLRDAIEADSLKVFLNLGEFAETVAYHPHKSVVLEDRVLLLEDGSNLLLEDGGKLITRSVKVVRPPRTIRAVVFREDLVTLGEDDGQTVVPQFTVHVKNDSAEGISSAEIDLGADQLEFPRRDGKPPEKRSILRMIDQDHGMLVLQCH